MFFYNKNHQVNEKRQKFSIRKYKVGTFSVVVGALFYLNGISNMVQATEVPGNTPTTSVEEKQSEEATKEKESKQEVVNTAVTHPTVEEKKVAVEKTNEAGEKAKVEDSVIAGKTENVVSEPTLSKVESKEKEEGLKKTADNQKDTVENNPLVTELQKVIQEGNALTNTIHIAFKLELEQLTKEVEETAKTPKNITKEVIKQYQEKIQNLKKNNDEYQKVLNEKVNKIKALQEEINSISSSIEYTFEPEEKALLTVSGEFSVSRQTIEEANGLITSLKQLRNKVANRMTRGHSGKRDPRNGQPIAGKDESGFRAIWISPIANKYEGSNNLVNENRTNLTFYNSDTLFSVMTAYGKRGNGEPLVRYQMALNEERKILLRIM